MNICKKRFENDKKYDFILNLQELDMSFYRDSMFGEFCFPEGYIERLPGGCVIRVFRGIDDNIEEIYRIWAPDKVERGVFFIHNDKGWNLLPMEEMTSGHFSFSMHQIGGQIFKTYDIAGTRLESIIKFCFSEITKGNPPTTFSHLGSDGIYKMCMSILFPAMQDFYSRNLKHFTQYISGRTYSIDSLFKVIGVVDIEAETFGEFIGIPNDCIEVIDERNDFIMFQIVKNLLKADVLNKMSSDDFVELLNKLDRINQSKLMPILKYVVARNPKKQIDYLYQLISTGNDEIIEKYSSYTDKIWFLNTNRYDRLHLRFPIMPEFDQIDGLYDRICLFVKKKTAV